MAAPAKPSRRRLAIATRAGMALCVIIAGLWVVSGWSWVSWEIYRSAQWGLLTGVSDGRLTLASAWGPYSPSRQSRLIWGMVSRGPGVPTWRPWFEYEDFRGSAFSALGQVLWIPLWAPLIVVAAPTAIMWRRLRRPLPGHCRCGYNLEGITSGVCPECGVRHAQA